MSYKLCVFVFSSHFCFSKNAFSCRFFSCYLVQMSFSFCLTLHALSTLVSSSKIMISILTTVSVYVLIRIFKDEKDCISIFPEAAIGGVLSKKVFLEISPNSQENTCAKVSGTGAFLWIWQNFWKHLFYRTPPVDCFCLSLR